MSHFMSKIKAWANGAFLKLTGGTMTGKLTLQNDQYTDNYTTGALDLKNSNIQGVNSIYTADVSDNAQEGIHFYRDSTHVDSVHAKNGVLYFTPNRQLGTYGTPEEIPRYSTGENGATTHFTIRPYIDQCRPNRLMFLPANQIIVEQTVDGGATWTSANVSDSVKTTMFSGINSAISIPRINGERSELCSLRITITGMRYNVPDGTAETDKYAYWNSSSVLSSERYFNVREWWFWVGSNSDTIGVKIESSSGASPDNWSVYAPDTTRLTGWSGSSWVKAGGGATFGGGTGQTGNRWNWRLTFTSRMLSGKTAFTGTSAQSIYQIRCFGDNVWGAPNNFMRVDHLYSWDISQNAIFPAGATFAGGDVSVASSRSFVGRLKGGLFPTTIRPSSANTTGYGALLNYFLATGSMSTGKPTAGDGHILDMEWDNNGHWHGQLAVPTDATKHVQWRTEAGGTWMQWANLLDSKDLSSATNSSSETLVATPKAVKAAYDLASSASTTAGQAMSAATGALVFKVTYSVSGSTVTCAAHVYSAGTEVTSNHADSCFVWSMSLDGGSSWVSLGTGKTKAVTTMTAFGGNVKCDFTPAS